MKKWFQKNKWVLAGLVLGAAAGFIYWKQVGCKEGVCMITSRWQNSTLYGAVMGGLLFSLFNTKNKDE